MNLTKKQLDALKEVGNIGCGNAASALAEFLGRRITMSVPSKIGRASCRERVSSVV